MKELPRYRCHKEVRAVKIAEVRQSPVNEVFPGGSWQIIPEGDHEPITVSHDFIVKRGLKVGGYLVVYDDGYTSFSPAKAFEDGYTLIEDLP